MTKKGQGQQISAQKRVGFVAARRITSFNAPGSLNAAGQGPRALTAKSAGMDLRQRTHRPVIALATLPLVVGLAGTAVAAHTSGAVRSPVARSQFVPNVPLGH